MALSLIVYKLAETLVEKPKFFLSHELNAPAEELPLQYYNAV